MEGMPYIVIPSHLKLKSAFQDEARKIAAKVKMTVADERQRNVKFYSFIRKFLNKGGW